MTTINLNALEIAAIDRQRARFGWVSISAIVVSFVHMAAALILFSGAAWYERAAALGMTALVDLATWAVAEYLDYARRRGLARSRWIKALFGFALVISMFLNGAYLWAHRPPAEALPGWLSAGIAVAFAVFVPLLIAVASLARGELTDDRLQLQQGAQAEERATLLLADTQGQLRTLEDDLRSARALAAQTSAEAAHWQAQVAQLGTDRDSGHAAAERERARAAQLEQQLAQLSAERAQTSADAAQWRARAAQWETAERELRATVAQLEDELRTALAAGAPNPVAVARRLIALGESQRQAAEFVGLKESTLRSRLAAGREAS